MSNHSDGLDVEVSIVNHELREGLRACLRSLPLACEGLAWGTSVIDNVSRDGSLEMLDTEFTWVKVLRNRRRLGFGPNHNQVLDPGLVSGSARYFLVLNNDTDLQSGAVSELVRFMDSHSEVGAVSPQLVEASQTRRDIAFPFPTVGGHIRHTLRPGRTPAPRTATGPHWLNGACLMLRAKALSDVGTFDERFFMFFEDTDLQARLSRAGWSSAVCEGATVVHHSGQTVKKAEIRLAMECQLLRSRYLYFMKHHGPRQAMAVSMISRLALWARAAKLVVEAAVRRDTTADEGLLCTVVELARYDPKCPLQHELASHLEVRPDDCGG